MVLNDKPPEHYLGYIVAGKVPVILIPGILGKWSFMKHLGDQISLKGHPVYIVPGLRYNVFSIPSSARKLRAVIVHIFPKIGHFLPRVSEGARNIREIVMKENIKGAVLVAHSKGGLVGKYYLLHYNNDHRVIGMVAIASPFAGSAMAKLIPHKSFKELREDSRVIRDLEKHEEANKDIISIIPEYDNHVWSSRGSYLPGAQNVIVSVKGHHKVIFDKNVEKEVTRSVEKITSASRTKNHSPL